ncbi:hypothetical protein [Streptomyces californicus]|uniref:hypothetical protein n=1 Tax=Streptomyces californicus TaxID=67351 RepID=UPI0033C8D14D
MSRTTTALSPGTPGQPFVDTLTKQAQSHPTAFVPLHRWVEILECHFSPELAPRPRAPFEGRHPGQGQPFPVRPCVWVTPTGFITLPHAITSRSVAAQLQGFAAVALAAPVFLTLFSSSSPLVLSDRMSRAAVAPAPCISGERERRSGSSVDDGEIRWTDRTRYDESLKHALKTWQFSGAAIKLRPDTATTVNDLEFRDYRGGTADRAAVAQYVRDSGTAATDYVRFNRDKMSGRSRAFMNSAAAHELGHALGLCHKGGRVLSLMWTDIASPPITSPQAVDKANYRNLWR